MKEKKEYITEERREADNYLRSEREAIYKDPLKQARENRQGQGRSTSVISGSDTPRDCCRLIRSKLHHHTNG